MFDLAQYNKFKEKDLINKVQKTNTESEDALTYAVYVKKFELDGASVVQLPDEVVSVAHKELIERRAKVLADAQAEAESIDAFIADAQNGE
jgi:hypothetical protein